MEITPEELILLYKLTCEIEKNHIYECHKEINELRKDIDRLEQQIYKDTLHRTFVSTT